MMMLDEIDVHVVKQSNFISQGVDTGGAGDQGIMVGYACDDNQQIPQELYLARQLCQLLYEDYPYDGKTQVTLDDGVITAVVASFQKTSGLELYNRVEEWLDDQGYKNPSGSVEIHCNPAGRLGSRRL